MKELVALYATASRIDYSLNLPIYDHLAYKLLPKTAAVTLLSASSNANFTVSLSEAVKKSLASGKAFTVLVSYKFQPEAGGKAVLGFTHFKLKAKKVAK